MKRSSAALTAAAFAVGLSLAGVALAAPANAAPAACPSGASCFWSDANYKTGTSTADVTFQNYIPNFQCWNYGPTQVACNVLTGGSGNSNDTATSVYNNGNSESDYWYQGSNQSGYSFSLAIKDYASDLATAIGGRSFNNVLSSGYFDFCLTTSCT